MASEKIWTTNWIFTPFHDSYRSVTVVFTIVNLKCFITTMQSSISPLFFVSLLFFLSCYIVIAAAPPCECFTSVPRKAISHYGTLSFGGFANLLISPSIFKPLKCFSHFIFSSPSSKCSNPTKKGEKKNHGNQTAPHHMPKGQGP